MNTEIRHSQATLTWPRRRVFSVIAAAAGLPLLARSSSSATPNTRTLWRWRGNALGANATITLAHPNATAVRRILTQCVAEIRRLERIFSLFDPASELNRLNGAGVLAAPSLDLQFVMREAQRISGLTNGAFDVTVQPLWALYSSHFRRHPDDADGPAGREIAHARRLVDYRKLEIGRGRIAFAKEGMAATLNGIAQGYISDRVSGILRSEGFDRVLVDVGEISAVNPPNDNRPWRISVENAAGDATDGPPLLLVNQAVASSRGGATRFDRRGRHHHLFDPATGRSARPNCSVTVIAGNAMTADAASTALAVASYRPDARLLRACHVEKALIQDDQGKTGWIGAG